MDKVNEISKEQKENEKLLIAKVMDKIKFCESRNKIENTDFLDLSQQQTIIKILEIRHLDDYELNGGFSQAERKILVIFPKKMLEKFNSKNENKIIQTADYNCNLNSNNIMEIIRITVPKEQYGTYEHKNYLGALMKLGLKREKIGDIIVRENGADIIILKDIEKIVLDNLKNLTRFKKSKIEIAKLEDLEYVKPKEEVIKINIPSMRLDCLVGELARCSRNAANELLKQERVFVNFKEEIRGSVQIDEGTYITIRGKGRFKVLKKLGITRSGRLSVEIQK